MITELNSLELLTPAFNKSLLKVESDLIGSEKFQYLFDVLLNEYEASNIFNAFSGFPAYAGFTALSGGIGTDSFVSGDSVVLFDNTSGVNTGIYRVKAVPDSSTIILDSLWNGLSISGGQLLLYKIKRNKLPSSPDGTATFNANSFSAGIVGSRFNVNDFGMFNVKENFEPFKYLAHEELYEPISFTSITNISISGSFVNVALVVGASYMPEVNQVITIEQNAGSEYNGTWEVLALNGPDEFIISASFVGVVGSGVAGLLPKLARTSYNFADVSEERLVFNGALPFPKDLAFDYNDYDATQGNLTPAKFLTTIPNGTKVKINDKGYIHFFQSDKNSVTQYYIDVVDELGIIQQYIVNLAPQQVNDFMQGISVGAGDLNLIPVEQFETVSSRGLPIIQECDKSFEVYLFGSVGCGTNTIQTVQFEHPINNALNNGLWNSNNWIDCEIRVASLEIDGIIQPLNLPNPQTVTKNDWLSQPLREDYYADILEAITGLTIENATEIDASVPYAIFGNPLNIEIDFSKDFKLQVFLTLNKVGKFLKNPPPTEVSVYYEWNSSTCNWFYRINGLDSSGFIGLINEGVSAPEQLSEKKEFILDWSCCGYTGARLIFQDRLGSMAGFNFTLKKYDKLNVSSDAFEQENFDIDTTSEDRGFKTIQYSYDRQITINSDWLTQEEMDYLEEAMTSPNCFLQIGTEVIPAIVIPDSKVIPNKENNGLIRMSLDLKLYGTQFSQRN